MDFNRFALGSLWKVKVQSPPIPETRSQTGLLRLAKAPVVR